MLKYLIISFNNVKTYNIFFGNFNYAKDLQFHPNTILF